MTRVVGDVVTLIEDMLRGEVVLMEENRQHPSIRVVIPALNEAENLHYVLPYIPLIRSLFYNHIPV